LLLAVLRLGQNLEKLSSLHRPDLILRDVEVKAAVQDTRRVGPRSVKIRVIGRPMKATCSRTGSIGYPESRNHILDRHRNQLKKQSCLLDCPVQRHPSGPQAPIALTLANRLNPEKGSTELRVSNHLHFIWWW